MPARTILFASLSLLLLGSIVSPARAQGKLPPPTESARVKGLIKAMEGNLMQVIPENSKDLILVQMPAEVQHIKLTGKALAAWLSPGLTVRFIGRFDMRGKAQDPIRKLDVITLRKPVPGEAVELPGVYPQIETEGGGGAFDGAGAGVRPKPRGKEPGGMFKVIGQIMAVRNNQLMVGTGAMNVMAEIAQDAEITVEIGDYRFAAVGDAVEVDGKYYLQAPNQIYANRVTIQSCATVGLPRRRRAPTRRGSGQTPCAAGRREGQGTRQGEAAVLSGRSCLCGVAILRGPLWLCDALGAWPGFRKRS